MKHFTLFSMILGILVGMGFSNESHAQAAPVAQMQIGQKSYHVAFRIDRVNHEAYVAFYGPATRSGVNVSVNIYQSSNGVLVHQEQLTTQGGGKYEKFMLDALDPGEYTAIVSGGKYNLSQPFSWF